LWTYRQPLFQNNPSGFRVRKTRGGPTGTAPRATFRNLALNTFRLAGRANIAHARRDLHDRNDTFAVYGI
jgi:hypothetical protein